MFQLTEYLYKNPDPLDCSQYLNLPVDLVWAPRSVILNTQIQVMLLMTDQIA